MKAFPPWMPQSLAVSGPEAVTCATLRGSPLTHSSQTPLNPTPGLLFLPMDAAAPGFLGAGLPPEIGPPRPQPCSPLSKSHSILGSRFLLGATENVGAVDRIVSPKVHMQKR